MSSRPPASESALTWLSSLERPPNSPHEALALYVHALLLHHGFRPSTSSNSTLPTDWGVGGWGGRYRHSRSSLIFEVRVTAVAARLCINAAAAESRDGEDGDIQRLEVKVNEYVNTDENGNVKGFEGLEKKEEVEDMKKRWRECLKKIDDFATLVQINISHKLVPDSAKAGYEAAASSSRESSDLRTGRRPQQHPSPMPIPGPRPLPPMADDDDPLRIGPPRRPPIPSMTGDPYGIGHDDLNAPGFPNPFRHPAMPGGMQGGGGMFVGPDHPMFRQPARRQPRGGGRIPPGARFDPHGPRNPPDQTYGQDVPDPARFGNNPDIETPPPPDMYW